MPEPPTASTSRATREDKTTNSIDPNEQLFLSAISQGGSKGIYDEDLKKDFNDLTNEQRATIINKLISKRLIVVYKAGERLLFKVRTEETKNIPDTLKGADTEEKIVYEIIRDAGNKGIWMRDIRFESKLQPIVLNKILKSLENKKIIKAVKSVSACKKKVYMLYELEPDSTLTGGSWYSDQDFESEFVDVLNQQCYRFLLELKQKHESEQTLYKKGPIAFYNIISATPEVVCKFITDLRISNVTLSVDDIQAILETLVYDGKVVRVIKGSGERLYRAVPPLTGPAGLITTPCGTCPIMKDCSIGTNTSVSPISCPYLTSWGTKPLVKPNTTDF